RRMGREFFARQGKKRRNTGCIPSIFDAAGRKKTDSDGVPGDFKQALRKYGPDGVILLNHDISPSVGHGDTLNGNFGDWIIHGFDPRESDRMNRRKKLLAGMGYLAVFPPADWKRKRELATASSKACT
ncbi:MAG: hypothetical protein HFF18_01450, partial [Oscillospiraceae bacterium]|nr:hypothetical protein [Oscillospiraceae bacterium]